MDEDELEDELEDERELEDASSDELELEIHISELDRLLELCAKRVRRIRLLLREL